MFGRALYGDWRIGATAAFAAIAAHNKRKASQLVIIEQEETEGTEQALVTEGRQGSKGTRILALFAAFALFCSLRYLCCLLFKLWFNLGSYFLLDA